MAAAEAIPPAEFLATLVPLKQIRQKARELGVVKRRRKVDVVPFLLFVVLTLCGRHGQSLAGLRQAWTLKSGVTLARSAFQARFSASFEELVGWLLEALETRAQGTRVKTQGVLAPFRDVVAIDATVISVHASLASKWKGTKGAAGVKVHTWVRALTGELLRHRITAEAYADHKAFGFQEETAKGALFLFDRGYAWPTWWWRIHRLGGYFLTRLPAGHDPVIVSENRRHRGQARSLVHLQLRRAIDGLQRSVLDVQASFNVRVRKYRKKRGRREQPNFRVVGLRHPDSGELHLYVTNIPPEFAKPEDLRTLYRLRWEVETFFKTGKSGLGLDDLKARSPHVVRTLIKAALVRHSVAMQAKRLAENSLPKGRWINPGQWVRVWALALPGLVARACWPKLHFCDLSWSSLVHLAMDPERRRAPLRYAVQFMPPPEPRLKPG